MHSRKRASTQKIPVPRSPDFDAGLLPEPLLAFQGGHHHVDPKIGLGLYGPHSLVGQARPALTSIIVGLVGPPAMVADTEQWLIACQGVIVNDGREPFLRPHFPGFSASSPFKCDLIVGDAWKEVIRPAILSAAVSEPDFYERIRHVLGLYLEGIQVLSQRDRKPHAILYCRPQEVVDHCAVGRRRVVAGRRLMRRVRRRVADPQGYQLHLFERLEPPLGIEEQEPGHQNLRGGRKAEAMQYGIPTQIVWPRTVRFSEDRLWRWCYTGNARDPIPCYCWSKIPPP
jgi:hypothetical protein